MSKTLQKWLENDKNVGSGIVRVFQRHNEKTKADEQGCNNEEENRGVQHDRQGQFSPKTPLSPHVGQKILKLESLSVQES